MPAIPAIAAPAPAAAHPCPVDDWNRHHAAAKADAATGAPITPHGQSLLSSARPAPGGQVFGECLCGSSFLFTLKTRSPL